MLKDNCSASTAFVSHFDDSASQLEISTITGRWERFEDLKRATSVNNLIIVRNTV